jgi:hypothetical protein
MKAIEVVIVLAMVGIVGAVSFRGCSDRAGATKALNSMGFTDVTLWEPAMFFTGCEQGEKVNHRFLALNAQRQKVEGTVCCGGPLSFKGCTVRF